MRRFIPVIVSFFLLLVASPVWAQQPSLQDQLLIDTGLSADSGSTDTTIRGDFLTVGLDYLVGILAIVAVGMFIYTGYRLLMADGQEEEHKKAWVAFLYVAIGLAVVPLSYAAVRIVLGLNIN